MARRILLADDSVTAQNMGRRILSDAGYEVITVNNGSAALKKVSEQAPDVIVLDVYMPGYGGLEVCQRLKEVHETARIPILLTVGKLEPFKPDEVRRVRADAFIVKPFEATELLAALTKLEDKIVPQAADFPRSGRSRSSASEGTRSEEDTGWKNRLSIPPGGKGRSPEGLEADDFGQGAPAEVAKEAQKPAPVAEQPAAAAQSAEETKKPEAVQAPAANVQEVSASEGKTAETAKEKEPEKETVAVAQVESSAIASPAAITAEAGASAAASGPRWIAESASLSADDTAISLDREMEKSLAANAAYDAGQQVAEAQKQEEAKAPAAKAEEIKTEVAKAEEVKPEEPAAPSAAVAETKVAESSSAAEVAVPAELSAEQPTPVAQVTIPAKQEAYAAAASMGATASDSVASESHTTATTESDSAQINGKQQLTATWEQWQNVRESVLNSPVAEQITEAAAASLKSAAEAASGKADIEAVASPTASNPTNIANIVDSVLAELKPKLVEEIAKKLGNDKK